MAHEHGDCPECGAKRRVEWLQVAGLAVPILMACLGGVFAYGQFSASFAALREETARAMVESGKKLEAIDASRSAARQRRTEVDVKTASTLSALDANIIFLSQQVAGIQQTLRLRAAR